MLGWVVVAVADIISWIINASPLFERLSLEYSVHASNNNTNSNSKNFSNHLDKIANNYNYGYNHHAKY